MMGLESRRSWVQSPAEAPAATAPEPARVRDYLTVRPASKIIQDCLGILVWWKDWVEHSFNSTTYYDQSQSLDESFRLKLKGWKSECLSEFELRIVQQFVGKIVPLRKLDLFIETLRTDAEDFEF